MERLSRHAPRGAGGSGISKALATALILAIALLVAHQGASLDATDSPDCELRVTAQGRIIGVTGVLTAPAATSGHYQLVVEKHGPSGRSRNMQSGRFAARADDAETQLGAMSFRLSPGDRLRAELIIRVEDRVICTASL